MTEGTRPEEIDEAKAALEAQQAVLAQIEQQVKELTIASPVDGVIEAVELRTRSEEATLAFIRATRSIVLTQIRPARYRELVRAARRPALVIHGGRDVLVPVEAAGIAAAGHADWELCVFPDLGHIPMMEAPGRWLAAVGSWLDRTRTEAASV